MSDPSVPARAPDLAAVTVSLADGDHDLVLRLGRRVDPEPVLAAVEKLAGSGRMVVDRSGTPLRGALLGRDLLNGDRLVREGDRTSPMVAAITGPLRGAEATVSRDLHFGRGGRIGDRTISDPEVSRDHLRVTPTPGAVRVVDPGSLNGTWVNEERIESSADLYPGDRLALGQSTLVLFSDPPRGDHLTYLGPSIRVEPGSPPPATTPRELWPDLPRLVGAIAALSEQVWALRPDQPGFRTVRVGTREVTGIAGEGDPSSVDLTTGSIAIVGAEELRNAQTAALLTRLASRHRPRDLRLGLLLPADGSADSERLANAARWLPHVTARRSDGFHAPWWRRGGDAVTELRTHLERRSRRRPTDWLAVAVDRSLVDQAEAEALDRAAAAGAATVIWLVEAGGPVPPAVATGIEIEDEDRATIRRRDTTTEVAPDLMATHLFDRLARQLAPLIEADDTRR